MEGRYPASGGWPKLIPSSREEFERWDRQWEEQKKELQRKREERDIFLTRLGITLVAVGVVGLLIFAIALSF